MGKKNYKSKLKLSIDWRCLELCGIPDEGNSVALCINELMAKSFCDITHQPAGNSKLARGCCFQAVPIFCSLLKKHTKITDLNYQ